MNRKGARGGHVSNSTEKGQVGDRGETSGFIKERLVCAKSVCYKIFVGTKVRAYKSSSFKCRMPLFHESPPLVSAAQHQVHVLGACPRGCTTAHDSKTDSDKEVLWRILGKGSQLLPEHGTTLPRNLVFLFHTCGKVAFGLAPHSREQKKAHTILAESCTNICFPELNLKFLLYFLRAFASSRSYFY